MEEEGEKAPVHGASVTAHIPSWNGAVQVPSLPAPLQRAAPGVRDAQTEPQMSSEG